MISIIVPVYNAQKYIKRCVESIVNQSYQKWELILIDDGSKDESSLICDELKQTDSRIHVVHTVNQGASAARNRGLDEAAGDYITFVDADDWVEPNHLEVLVNQIDSDVDLCINSFIADLYYGSRPYQYKEVKTQDNIESINAFFTILLQHSQFLWNKLFKSNIIKDNHIRFNTSISLGEDNIFILEYLNYIRGLSASSVCTYHYD
ncbi:glycosyltransferase family 2 protein, partial [Prevotella sp. P3-122]|uniref:glycosyltransferase family 2 protein n=1 Tax=Prevotella sp. P3-122 TaxID=2024223 RepID=UPI000BC94C15